ncbi:MAG: sugar phosphate nucleotidyltransferase, partial [Candidatus Omnitrophota bacterium]
MKALILAAGYARRLYPITKEFPKPLLLVKHR